MRNDDDRVFTKRGAALGVIAIVGVTLAIVAVGAAVSALILVVF